MKNFFVFLPVLAISIFVCSSTVYAQEVHQDLIEVVKATVIEIVSEDERDIMGTDTTALVQEVKVKIESGQDKGKKITFENDVAEVEVGDRIYLQHLQHIDGSEYYLFKDFNRLRALFMLGISFVIVLWAVARWKGVRALLSLVASISIIIFVLMPLLLAGYDPVVVSVAIASVMLALAIFATHGFGANALIAFFGTTIAIVLTGALSYLWVSLTQLTGFSSDAAIYLNFSTHGALDFSGLLLGGILIGVIGVLDDVAITQASVTLALARANATYSFYELYRRSLAIGQDHIGSLVNTLALAYTGVSLPLLLLFARTDSGFFDIINQEIVASEIVRTLVGSLGLMLTVPLTTLIAVWWVKRYGVSHDEHAHHHGHTH